MRTSILRHSTLSYLVVALALFSCKGGSGNDDADTGETGDCEVGSLGCECDLGSLCDPGLACMESVCTDPGGPANCGDGNLDPDEACDLGDANADDGLCKLDCTEQVCGDGHVGPGETCDDGNDDESDDCTSVCEAPACGDGFVQTGEECDDGNDDDSDGCVTGCTLATCGDGFVQSGEEECDDGNADDADDCAKCLWTSFPDCGNGKVDGAEICYGNSEVVSVAQPIGVAIADVSGDGTGDLIIAQTGNSDRLRCFVSKGDGTFENAITSVPLGSEPRGFSSGDLDGDGVADFVVVDLTSGNVYTVYGGTQADTPFASTDSFDPLLSLALATAVGDFDMDGRADIAIGTVDGNMNSAKAGVFRQEMAGTFDGIAFDVSGGAFLLTAADVDGDGRTELATLTNKPSVQVFEDDDIEIALRQEVDNVPGIGLVQAGIASGDLDGDGDDDIATVGLTEACPPNDPGSCSKGSVSVIFAKNGDDTAIDGTLEYLVGKEPAAVVIVDINGDGNLDIVTANRISDDITILRGIGEGEFGPPLSFPVQAGSNDHTLYLAAGDMNDDGILDLAIADNEGGSARYLLSDP